LPSMGFQADINKRPLVGGFLLNVVTVILVNFLSVHPTHEHR